MKFKKKKVPEILGLKIDPRASATHPCFPQTPGGSVRASAGDAQDSTT